LVSVALQPVREVNVATTGSDFHPALLLGRGHVLDEAEVSGADVIPRSGDQVEGSLIHAQLLGGATQLAASHASGVASSLEFIAPLAVLPQGSYLHGEVAGLDPESRIEVSVNGQSQGVMGIAPFALNDPGILFDPLGRVIVAGWQSVSLYLPARLWKQGDNSVVLTLQRAAGDAGQVVSLRQVNLDLLFPSGGSKSVTSSDSTTNVILNGVSNASAAPHDLSAPILNTSGSPAAAAPSLH
jgi:hypothetical protein